MINRHQICNNGTRCIYNVFVQTLKSDWLVSPLSFLYTSSNVWVRHFWFIDGVASFIRNCHQFMQLSLALWEISIALDHQQTSYSSSQVLTSLSYLCDNLLFVMKKAILTVPFWTHRFFDAKVSRCFLGKQVWQRAIYRTQWVLSNRQDSTWRVTCHGAMKLQKTMSISKSHVEPSLCWAVGSTVYC